MKRPFKRILYGGDYNPNQWGKEVWKEDMRIFKDARINSATINVFSWAKIQPSEEIYNFTELDEIIDMLSRENYDIVLATSTGALPAWMVKRYPEVARTDYEGRHHKFGQRHNACPNSPVFQKFASRLAGKLAERYGDNPHVTCWHISNEYGGECYCENCEKAFRVWLRGKYQTLDELNKAWNTEFWGHTIYDWDEVVLPDALGDGIEDAAEPHMTAFAGLSIDYCRFNSDGMLNNFKMEKEAIRKFDKETPITTNMMGTFKGLDYFKWAKEIDVISWDNYPSYNTPWSMVAMKHDLMRGLKQGKPFALMEQTPGVSNWHIYCKLKRPGVMRLWSYEAVAHGADTVMFFQMRRSMGACEKYHSGVIEHVGTDDTRVFREITALGAELDKLQGVTLGARAKSDVAIVFDWDNWWAAELSAGPSKLINYTKEVSFYYRAFFRQNISVDFVSVEDDLSSYKLVVAPMLYMCKDGFDEKVREYVQQGGSFLTTYFSGYVEDHDLVTLGGYPGRLKDILGIWVEESDALPPEENNSFVYEGKQYPAGLLCDLMHLRGAKEIASYESDFYAGMPVLTENEFGNGKAYYVGARSNEEFYKKYLGDICESLGIRPVAKTPEGIEATARYNDNGEFLFLLNNTQEEKEVVMEEAGTDLLTDQVYAKGDTLTLEKYGVAIVKR